jgi:hypothetical protein
MLAIDDLAFEAREKRLGHRVGLRLRLRLIPMVRHELFG